VSSLGQGELMGDVSLSRSSKLTARSGGPLATPDARALAEEALLDAAERLLIEMGHAKISTRRLAREAQLNHGLVHYYFGSMENVLARALERFTKRLIERQRELYSSDMPFVEKWRLAMRYLTDADLEYQKLWYELQALSWNSPELREQVASVNDEWRLLLRAAFAEPLEEYKIPMPLDALVALVMTFNEGIILEQLAGITTGHRELIAWIDSWIASGGRA
jgi:AcrR family transcriptional regulator